MHVSSALNPQPAAAAAMVKQASHNRGVGKWGEGLAARHLTRRGYEIMGRNVRTPYGEIDLVAQKDGVVIFVEVKARFSSTGGPPELSVTPRKQQHMIACAEHYAQENGIDHWQIHVIAVQRVAGKPEIVHFENAVS